MSDLKKIPNRMSYNYHLSNDENAFDNEDDYKTIDNVDCSHERLNFEKPNDANRKKVNLSHNFGQGETNTTNNSYSGMFLRKKDCNQVSPITKISSSKERNDLNDHAGSINNYNNINRNSFQLNKNNRNDRDNKEYNNITDNSIKLSARNSIINASNANNNNYNNINDLPPCNFSSINIPPIYPHAQTTKNSNISNNYNKFKRNLPNRNNKSSGQSRSQSGSIDLTNLSQDKNLSPKSDFKFHNAMLSRSKSNEKLKLVKKEVKMKTITYNNNNKSVHSAEKINMSNYNIQRNESFYTNNTFNTLDSNFSSVDLYLQRRHTEAQMKLQNLKVEKMKKEEAEIRDRPKISKNSQKIVENLVKTPGNVVDRLTSGTHDRKKSEKLNKIEEVNRKTRDKPEINPTSEKLQRTIDDLYFWQKDLNTKIEGIKQKQNQPTSHKPTILKESEDLLKERHPQYLKSKVEDRLLEKGLMTKYKLEDAKEMAYVNVLPGRYRTIEASEKKEKIENMEKNKKFEKFEKMEIKEKTENTEMADRATRVNKTTIEHEKDYTKDAFNRNEAISGNYKSDSRVIPNTNMTSSQNNLNRNVNSKANLSTSANKDRDRSNLKTKARNLSNSSKESSPKTSASNINNSTSNHTTDKPPMNKIIDIRKHLSNYYESKIQFNKKNELKSYMTTHTPSHDAQSENKIENLMEITKQHKNVPINHNFPAFNNTNDSSDVRYRHEDLDLNLDEVYKKKKVEEKKFLIKNDRTSSKQKQFNAPDDVYDSVNTGNTVNTLDYGQERMITFEDNEESSVQLDKINNNMNLQIENNNRYNFSRDFALNKNTQSLQTDNINNSEHIQKTISKSGNNNPITYSNTDTNKYQGTISPSKNKITSITMNKTIDSEENFDKYEKNEKNENFDKYEKNEKNEKNEKFYKYEKTEKHKPPSFTVFNSKFEEIKNTNNKRLQDLNIVNSYINNLSQEFYSNTQEKIKETVSLGNSHKINYIHTNSSNCNEMDEYFSSPNSNLKDIRSEAYIDSQNEQEKMRFEIGKKIKNQLYESEYNRVNNDLDYVNERLKLNELSKSYLMNKINEFTTVKSPEEGSNRQRHINYNNEQNKSQKNIGNNIETYKRKKITN